MKLSDANSRIVDKCMQLIDGYALTAAEKRLVRACRREAFGHGSENQSDLGHGLDAFGQAYMDANRPDELRPGGETYTPPGIVGSMLDSVEAVRVPQRVVDVGCGSGRFALAAALRFPEAQVLAIDCSPMATLMCKANASLLGIQDQVEVINKSILDVHIPEAEGASTCWIGNPPYVRHHRLGQQQKAWLFDEAAKLGYKASGLTGLHVYFFLAIARQYGPSDFGRLITSAEWLEVNYGKLARDLMVDVLGMTDLTVLNRRENVFHKVDTTAAIVGFDGRNKGGLAEVSVCEAQAPSERKRVSAERLAGLARWSPGLLLGKEREVPAGFVRLGEIARVHRGIVTGANKFWVRKPEDAEGLGVPVVAHAREISSLDGSIDDPSRLSVLIALPNDLNTLDGRQRRTAQRIIEEGLRLGIDQGYTAKARKHWWSIPIRGAAPILMTYMGRKPPTFVSNPKGCRNLNVIHGIYPKAKMSSGAISALVEYLNSEAACVEGRTYAGGLMKLEPKEAEKIIVPSLQKLESLA